MILFTGLTLFSALSFLCFGVGYLVFGPLQAEFSRYGLSSYRVLAALLQLAGGAGQLIGFIHPRLGGLASAGLALMMLIAVGVRLKIGDSLMQMTPAILFLVVELYLIQASFRR